MSELNPTRLRCEYREDPLGIDTRWPRLSWELQSDERGQIQRAYRILVASRRTILDNDRGDLWDSKKVVSNRTLHIVYSGRKLRSAQRVYWKVCAWGKTGQQGPWSEPASWEMALLEPKSWEGRWINDGKEFPAAENALFQEDPAPLFRKEFAVSKKIRHARAYISGLGYYELRLNGRRVGDSVLDPAWTDYAKRVYYSVYDVAELIQDGTNAVGITLGNGWYNPLPLQMWGKINLREHLAIGRPRVLLQLNIEFEDNTKQTISTNTDWAVADGPIRKNSVYLGERYDARCERAGWDRPAFDESGWNRPAIATEPLGLFRTQPLPPIRVTKTLKPVTLTEPSPGVTVFDFGQNFAGWVRLKVRGPAGACVRMRYGELLHDDGSLNGLTACAGQIKNKPVEPGSDRPATAWQQDEYLLKGEGEEIYTPRFTFHGFRYVEVTGYPGKPTLDALEGLRLNTAVESSGEFACSNDMFNRIQEMVRWTELSNIFGVQSDCPHREKFGYGGDIVGSGEMGILNFDMAAFYRKAVEDLADAARPNGGFTETAPCVGIADGGLGDQAGPVGWGVAHPWLQRQLFRYYGDTRLIQEQYERTKRWVELLGVTAKDHILDNGLSDHESLVPKPRALTGTAFYHYSVASLAKFARMLNKKEDAKRYTALVDQIKDAFNAKFLDPKSGRYDAGTQCCQSTAWWAGLAPKESRANVGQVLVDDILKNRDGHISGGIFGTKFTLLALTEMGRADVAYAMVNKKDFPGWGYMLENGATTLWEHWTKDANTYSHNHPMFGSVSEWFYKALAGIQAAPTADGFNQILIAPNIVGDLEWVRCHYDSIRGRIESNWRIEGDDLHLDIRIPPNTTAFVQIPTSNPSEVLESRKPVTEAEGVLVIDIPTSDTPPPAAFYRVDGGAYRFVAKAFRSSE